MNKKIFLIVLTTLITVILTACSEAKSIGIIGGADGPTKIFVAEPNE